MIKVISFILSSPLNRNRKLSAFLGFIRWQLASRFYGGQLVVDWIDGARLLVGNGEKGVTGNIYCGLAEFEDMSFILHGLREQDLFVDIGANVGVYTVLASKVVGAMAVNFEPVPSVFNRMLDQVYLNRTNEKVTCFNCGVGNEDGLLKFTSTEDTVNHVVLPGEDGETVSVRVVKLDGLSCFDFSRDIFVKIDVEGFEMNVLTGGREFFESERVKAIVIELNGSGARYGFDDRDIHEWILDRGFTAVGYTGIERRIENKSKFNSEGNTIYIRDIDEMSERCSSASPRKIHTVGGMAF